VVSELLELWQSRMGLKARTVEADDDGIRVDRWFKRHFPSIAHSALEKLLRTGQVRLDGKRVSAGDRVAAGQLLRLPPQLQRNDEAVPDLSTYSQPAFQQAGEKAKERAESLVIYKDSSVLVLNKPPGLATQGGSGIREHVDALLDFLRFEKKQRPRLVHRLDRDTSGVLVVARTAPAAANLSEALRRRDATKLYWALTKGVPKPLRGTIRSALIKDSAGRDERMVTAESGDPGAKTAITDYVVLGQAGQELAWVAVRPHTGRTHQIRVHLASIGTPIIGDFKYGGTATRGRGEIEDQLHLHARSIDIAHPDGGRLRVSAPLPPHLQRAWKLLGFDPNLTSNPFAARTRR
jgi:23S rRNA pseudouridine955/2504/2580 synthase